MTDDQARAFYNHSCFVESAGHIIEHIPLDRIQARTLIVNGAQDTILDLEDMRIAGSIIPNCEIRVVEDAGHFLHFERPEILGVYAEFLAR
jgi:pimeloyl-ACP methyl ester carboxylesterase